MAGRKSRQGSGKSWKCRDAVDRVSSGGIDRDEYDDRYESVVDRNVESYMKRFAEAIRSRSKEDVAAYSYGGGMLDAIRVTHDVLGVWGAEQLCRGLERELETEAREEVGAPGAGVSIQVRAGPGQQGLSAEEAKELGEKLAGWLVDRKNGHGRKRRDVMYG